jgi:hypothetical protein
MFLLVEFENTGAEPELSRRFGTSGVKSGCCVCLHGDWSLAHFPAVNGVLAEHFFDTQ